MAKIEHSCNKGRWTEAEARAAVRESRAFWNSPEGKLIAAQREVEQRSRKRIPAPYPHLAQKRGTAPIVEHSKPMTQAEKEIADMKAKLGIQ